jgi:hypothetical protein
VNSQTFAEPARAQASNTEIRRVVSVDALRGFDMFWILGADALVHAFNKIAEGSNSGFA